MMTYKQVFKVSGNLGIKKPKQPGHEYQTFTVSIVADSINTAINSTTIYFIEKSPEGAVVKISKAESIMDVLCE